MSFLPGTQAQARGSLWEVVHVEPAGEQQRVRLRSLLQGLRGRELDLLHPFERIEPVQTAFNPARAGLLAPWRLYHQAFLLDQELGAGTLSAAQPGRLTLEPYQLVPVMRALRMSRPRLLIADGVGLGKTVQAGLVLAELLARRRAHRILVVSPAGPLLNQWHRELRQRFGLRFDVLRDQGTLLERRRSIELHANPFDHISFCLTSVDFAKQEKVLQDLERATWDVVVIDEAHHCCKLGVAADREDSQRRRLAEVLARRCDGLLLLTATPHDGFDPHFASLVELLDPSLVDGRGTLRGEEYRRHVVRRLKHHVKGRDGKPLFPERTVEPIPVPFADRPAYSALQTGMLELVVPRLSNALRRKRFGEVLAFVSLLKRSVSTVAACLSTLHHVADRYGELLKKGAEEKDARQQRLRTLRDFRRRLEKFGTLSFEEEQDQAVLEAEEIAAELFEGGDADGVLDARIGTLESESRRQREQRARLQQVEAELRSLVALAERAAQEDVKLAAVLARVQSIRKAKPGANVLVYTEYTDSQDAVVAFLEAGTAAGQLDGEILAISGPDAEARRIEVTDRFGQQDGIVLVSTDATAEGLNLHRRCHHLVHVELPYNPNRLEQRNGRIDRYGQREIPDIAYLYLQRTFEERLLLRLVRKVERQRKRLTFVPDTLGEVLVEDAAEEKLVAALAREQPSLFASSRSVPASEAEDTDAPAYRELLAEVDRAIDGYEKTSKGLSWLGESGLHAEESVAKEAEAARARGEQQSTVLLLDFVAEAVETDLAGSSWRDAGVLSIRLPPAWQTPELEGLPGWNPGTGVIRLTSDRDLLRDDQGEIGFLGRAHPLVRRALDRVRNLQFGGGQGLDRRVSAAIGAGASPGVLWTFVGSLRSGLGRAFERVVAVRVDPSGRTTVTNAGEAMALARRPTPTAGLWDGRFASWAKGSEAQAQRAASESLSSMFELFRDTIDAELAQERRDLDAWLRARAEALTGAPVAETLTLFGGVATGPSWRSRRDPKERLAAFATDGDVPTAQRREAEGVLKLHQDRLADLDRRRPTPAEAIVPLGMLLLVPEPSP